MGSIFKPKAPKAPGPTAEQLELESRQKEQALAQESEIAEREAIRRRASSGRSSLLTGAATGVEDKQTTLG